ncbi:Mce family protein MceB [Nocardia nova SH22a]|uniref:Mce family protein MceB n=1 Tax=Nocardia nova SH22a TaxID=1415166 RepID=W5TJT0_9NOCA|nr:MCE family protein [Nocardia nova]AHH19472.1 Mce family protein MceB [Nocardia nova SH22a]
MSYRRPLVALILFLVVSVTLTWTVFVTLERSVPGDVDRYSAVFTDVSGLRTGDDVRVAGVRVGRVVSIDLDGTRAQVGFELQRAQRVYGNTLASITYQNLIGQRYLGLSMGDFHDPALLRPGASIPVEHTEPSFDLSALLNGFEPLFGLLKPQDVDNLTTALIRGLQGDEGAVTTLVAETSTLAESFAGPDQILGTVIDNLAKVVGDLAARSGQLQTTLTATRQIFDGLRQHRDTLFQQLPEISAVLDRAAGVVDGASPALREFLTRQPGFSHHFLDEKDKFAYLGANIPLLLKSLTRIVDSGSYLNAYICDIRMSIVPDVNPLLAALLATATPGGTAENSAICR